MTIFSRSFCVLFSVVLKHRPEELSTHAHTSDIRYLHNGLMVVFNQY